MWVTSGPPSPGAVNRGKLSLWSWRESRLVPGEKEEGQKLVQHTQMDVRSLPRELMSAKFSTITSRYRHLWASSRRPHSSHEKCMATSSKVTLPCHERQIKLQTFPLEDTQSISPHIYDMTILFSRSPSLGRNPQYHCPLKGSLLLGLMSNKNL
jgi:hypothetical protein